MNCREVKRTTSFLIKLINSNAKKNELKKDSRSLETIKLTFFIFFLYWVVFICNRRVKSLSNF